MSKKTLTDEELLAQFEDIPSAEASSPSATKAAGGVEEDDPLAELSALAAARPTSRPQTPRLSSSTTSGNKSKPEHTPASSGPPSNRTSEDRQKQRKSTESSRSYHQSFTPADDQTQREQEQEQEQQQQQQQAGGGWWGSVFSVATAAVKQAEQAVKDVRGNPEVLKYAEQLRQNVNVESLRAYGGNVRNMALPTFTSLLQTIAPPISQHERLQIHTTHDLLGYPTLDPIIYQVFARVMSQVEGGDLLVIQRGTESRQRGRSTSDVGYRGSMLGTSASTWTDGPWWREQNTDTPRNLGLVKGLVEGTKLSRANAEAYATDFFSSRGGVEEAAKQATQVLSETNPVRSSDIFLAIQLLSQPAARDLFTTSPIPQDDNNNNVQDPDDSDDDESALFAIYLYDPIHSLSFSTLSQSFPLKWTQWLDATTTTATDDPDALPDSIRDIVESGGIDPREWVAEWLQEVLSLAIGVVAQRYVAKRMGVGEGGIGKGKARQRAEEDAAGEAARAI